MDAVNAELRAKGLTLDDTNPDVAITYFGDHDEQTVIDTMHHGYGYGYDWYYGGLGTGMSSSTSTVRTYKQGTLVIDIYKVSDKRLMWPRRRYRNGERRPTEKRTEAQQRNHQVVS